MLIIGYGSYLIDIENPGVSTYNVYCRLAYCTVLLAKAKIRNSCSTLPHNSQIGIQEMDSVLQFTFNGVRKRVFPSSSSESIR